jgi:RNA polymerase sigma-70 factor (ECF subfamily)
VTDSDRTDAEVISASLENPAMFGVVFERHHGAVFRFAARRIGRQEARDVASEVFVRAFKIRYRYDVSKGNCLPWLYGIAGNVIGDRLRSLERGRRFLLFAETSIDRVEPFGDADDRLVADSVADVLNDALGRLSKRDRETLLLFALEGLTYAEIAVVLDIPVGTVGSRIARARKQIGEAVPDLEQMITPITQPDEQEGSGD